MILFLQIITFSTSIVIRTPEYLNKYILKIQGPVGLRLWNEF